MVSGVNSNLPASFFAADSNSPQSGQTPNSFSQQLLSALQSSLERLGVAAASVRLAPQGGVSSAQRQIVVTFAEEQPAAESAEPAQSAASAESPAFESMYEVHQGFNPRLFATEEMAGWLAQRLGGEVGTFRWEWSPEVPQPPRGYSIRFGDKEINAGALAMYFEPGRFVGADQEAALALFRDGVVNDYVRQHRPELIEEFGLPA